MIKALWADVVHENASRGVLATTSRVAVGAKKTVTARRYPIEIVEREAVQSWLGELRSPGTGLWLA